MTYNVRRLLRVVMLILGFAAIVLRIVEGGHVGIKAIGAGGVPIMIGGLLLGRSFRLEKQSKASADPAGKPE